MLEHLFVREKNKSYLLAKTDVYIFIEKKWLIQTLLYAHTYLYQRFSKTCICILFYFKGVHKSFLTVLWTYS